MAVVAVVVMIQTREHEKVLALLPIGSRVVKGCSLDILHIRVLGCSGSFTLHVFVKAGTAVTCNKEINPLYTNSAHLNEQLCKQYGPFPNCQHAVELHVTVCEFPLLHSLLHRGPLTPL